MNFAAVRTTSVWLLTLALAVTTLTVGPPPAAAQEAFSDTGGSVHAEAIELIRAAGITSGYPDGTYRPRGDVRRDQMATFLTDALGLKRQAPDFPDVPKESVHYGAIGALAASKITTGFADGTYRPLGFVTRGQMATFLTKGLDLPPGTRSFEDVPSDYVHADAIAALAASGITEGFGDGTFRPNAPVKRDQMASFLVRGLGLIECPPETDSSVSTVTTTSTSAETTQTDEDAVAERGSEDLEESTIAPQSDDSVATSSTTAAETEDLGPAVPAVFFPITSAIRVGDNLEAHSFGLPDSRSVRIDVAGGNQVTATTTNAAGNRTWATARINSDVFVGQWGSGSATNLWRYRSTNGSRTAQPIADVPDGGEFWSLAEQGTNRLWAGTRAHASGAYRRTIGLGTRGDVDNRHLVHRIDLSQQSVKHVFFEAPCMPTLDSGLRPDVKQVDTQGGTLYVGLGQQTGGARLYAFEPGNRVDIPQRDVRLISPDSVASGSGIFALEVDADHVAFGTQGGSGVDPRLVVLDRRTEQVRVDIRLPGETRVDAIALSDGTVVASASSGKLYRVTVPTSGTRTTPHATYAAPVTDQLNRFVEFSPGGLPGGLRGITNQGIVWTRASDGAVATTNLIEAGAPGAPGQPHSLHVGSAELAVGSNAAVNLRPLSDVADEPRTVSITGEAKALASAPNGDTFAAAYPHAQLWRIASGGSDAMPHAQWNEAFLRPADAVYDTRSDHVRVVAREDNAPRSGVTVPGSTDGRTVQLRPSRLFSLRAAGGSTAAELDGLTLAGDPAWPADEKNENNLIEARAVAVPASGGGATTYVGDSFGGVQAVDPTAAEGEEQLWYRQLGGTDPRPIVDVDHVDGKLVVTASGSPAGTAGTARTIVHDLYLDPATGEVVTVDSSELGTPKGTSATVGTVHDAVTRGTRTVFARPRDLIVYDRAQAGEDRLQVVATHDPSDTFGGPFVALDPASCDLFGIAARDLFRTQLPGCSGPLPLDE